MQTAALQADDNKLAMPRAPSCSSVCVFKRQGDRQIQQHKYKQYNRKQGHI